MHENPHNGYQPTSDEGNNTPPNTASSVESTMLEVEVCENVIMKVNYPHSMIEIMDKEKFNRLSKRPSAYILQVMRLNDSEVIVEYYIRWNNQRSRGREGSEYERPGGVNPYATKPTPGGQQAERSDDEN